jgi:hypothetical protein
MKQLRWISALALGALFLAACSSMQAEAPVGETGAAETVVVAPDPVLPAVPGAPQEPGSGATEEPGSGATDELGSGALDEPASGGSAAPGSDEQTYWHEYGYDEFGEDWRCNKYDGAAVNYVVPAPPEPYVWRLIVVRQGDLDHLFFDPAVGAELDTGGSYDHVIACKHITYDEPEPGVWCSPGFWRNSPIAAAAAAAAGGFSLDDPYGDFFDPIDGDPTLWEVLASPEIYGGGPFNDVGDLLSHWHPDVDFTGERVGDSCPLSADASMRD